MSAKWKPIDGARLLRTKLRHLRDHASSELEGNLHATEAHAAEEAGEPASADSLSIAWKRLAEATRDFASMEYESNPLPFFLWLHRECASALDTIISDPVSEAVGSTHFISQQDHELSEVRTQAESVRNEVRNEARRRMRSRSGKLADDLARRLDVEFYKLGRLIALRVRKSKVPEAHTVFPDDILTVDRPEGGRPPKAPYHRLAAHAINHCIERTGANQTPSLRSLHECCLRIVAGAEPWQTFGFGQERDGPSSYLTLRNREVAWLKHVHRYLLAKLPAEFMRNAQEDTGLRRCREMLADEPKFFESYGIPRSAFRIRNLHLPHRPWCNRLAVERPELLRRDARAFLNRYGASGLLR